MSGAPTRPGPYDGKGKSSGKGMDGAALSRMMIESMDNNIETLQTALAAAKAATVAAEAATVAAEAATVAAEAEADFWHQNFDKLMKDTKRRVREMLERTVVAVSNTQPEDSGATHSGH